MFSDKGKGLHRAMVGYLDHEPTNPPSRTARRPGIRALPDESAIQAPIKQTVKDAGFYIFPAPEERPDMTGAQKQQAMEKSMQRMATEPSGIMVVYPHGRDFQFPVSLGIQFGADVVAILLC